MILGLTFVTTWLLAAGLVATFIPFVLHLLSSVKAQEVFFPTLRFLQRSMEKTARRRRIQNLLLLLLRAALLAALALSAAEPISEATGNWLAGKRYAAVIIVDNSLSMGATDGGASRLARARSAVNELLLGEQKPALAAVLVTNDAVNPTSLTHRDRFDTLRKQVEQVHLSGGQAAMLPLVEEATRMLAGAEVQRKSVFLFSDLQQESFGKLITARQLAREAKDVHFLIVNTASPDVKNVGVTDLEVTGPRVANSRMTFTATLVNSSKTDRVVDVTLRVNGQPVATPIRKTLRGVGAKTGNQATVKFHHQFPAAGEFTGQVLVEQDDDLAQDNGQWFHVEITGPVKALVVRGQTDNEGHVGTDPAMLLNLALDPFGDPAVPWPIETKIISPEQFASTALAGRDVALFCEVPSFTPGQAAAVAEFTKGGGTAVFFLGPAVDAANYNRRFLPPGPDDPPADDGAPVINLLPGTIGKAVGEIGPEAKAAFVERIKMTSPYLAGLYDTKDEAGYRAVQVQRFFALQRAPSAEALMTLDNGNDLCLFRRHGQGKVLLFATTASPRWTTLAMNGLFLPMMNRVCLQARRQAADRIFAAGARVPIVPVVPASVGPDAKVSVVVTPPAFAGQEGKDLTPMPLRASGAGAGIEIPADRIGTYTWRLTSDNPDVDDSAHTFVVNPQRDETNLQSYTGPAFSKAMADAGMPRVYVGGTIKEVEAVATAQSQGRNWWDLLVAVAIIVLVVEAAVANRASRQDGDLLPAHLNARLAS